MEASLDDATVLVHWPSILNATDTVENFLHTTHALHTSLLYNYIYIFLHNGHRYRIRLREPRDTQWIRCAHSAIEKFCAGSQPPIYIYLVDSWMNEWMCNNLKSWCRVFFFRNSSFNFTSAVSGVPGVRAIMQSKFTTATCSLYPIRNEACVLT